MYPPLCEPDQTKQAAFLSMQERKRLKPLARKLWFVTLWSASDGGRKLGLLRGALEQAKKLGTWKGLSQGSETFSLKLQ